MNDNLIKIKRALISVFDKTNIVRLAECLAELDIEIVSTGGTARLLVDNNIKVTQIDEITKFPEILGGRVKTLHPNIYAGLLSRLNNSGDKKTIEEFDIEEFDLVVVNLYPFQKIVESTEDITEIIENIDIGGPSMIRASAKNYPRVTVVTETHSYDDLVKKLKKNGGLLQSERMSLAADAIKLTYNYDRIISNWFENYLHPEQENQSSTEIITERKLRYGENPHQSGELQINSKSGLGSIEQLQGKELSYNNINDIDAALQLIDDFKKDRPTFAIIKHANPCGVAQRDALVTSYIDALSCDPTSAFGGILIANVTIDAETASEIVKIFSEVVIAPNFSDDAIKILSDKQNLRVVKFNIINNGKSDNKLLKSVFGGYLVQERDQFIIDESELKTVTFKKPNAKQIEDLIFAFKVVKHVKSNAIVYVKNTKTIAIGAGQTSRVDSSRIAIQKFYENINDEKQRNGCVIASDAFFPFSDGLDEAIKFGASAVIQPGGSIRDEEVIETANNAGLSMVFTGFRHFKH